MELENAPIFARFIMVLFILLFLLAISPLVHNAIQAGKESLYCSSDYGILCIILDLTLPFLVIFLISLLISYLKGVG